MNTNDMAGVALFTGCAMYLLIGAYVNAYFRRHHTLRGIVSRPNNS